MNSRRKTRIIFVTKIDLNVKTCVMFKSVILIPNRRKYLSLVQQSCNSSDVFVFTFCLPGGPSGTLSKVPNFSGA